MSRMEHARRIRRHHRRRWVLNSVQDHKLMMAAMSDITCSDWRRVMYA